MKQTLSRQERLHQPKKRTWSIRLITILLAIQAGFIAYLSLDQLAEQQWQIVNGQPVIDEETLTADQLLALETAILFIPLTLYAGVAALSFFFLLRIGWLLALMMQSLTLAACLMLYFREGPSFIYVVMLYAILMVLYLNSFEVRVLFDSPAAPPEVTA